MKFNNRISEMFQKKALFDFDKEITRLEKEQRLEKKKILENTWKEKRLSYQRKNWAKEWLLQSVLPLAVRQGGEKNMERCKIIGMELVDKAMEVGEKRETVRAEERLKRLRKAAMKREIILDDIARKNRKEKAKMRHLEFKLKNWRVSDEGESKEESLKKRKKEWYHHETVEKRKKVESICCSWREEYKHQETTICDWCMEEIINLENLHPISETLPSTNLELKNTSIENEEACDGEVESTSTMPSTLLKIIEQTKTETSPEKTLISKKIKENKHASKVKVKKWAKKPNGLYGWIYERTAKKSLKTAPIFSYRNGGKKSEIKPSVAESGSVVTKLTFAETKSESMGPVELTE